MLVMSTFLPSGIMQEKYILKKNIDKVDLGDQIWAIRNLHAVICNIWFCYI